MNGGGIRHAWQAGSEPGVVDDEAAGLEAEERGDRHFAGERPGRVGQVERQRRLPRPLKGEVEPAACRGGEREPMESIEMRREHFAGRPPGRRVSTVFLKRGTHQLVGSPNPHVGLRRHPHRPGCLRCLGLEAGDELEELPFATIERRLSTKHLRHGRQCRHRLEPPRGAGLTRFPEQRVHGAVDDRRHGRLTFSCRGDADYSVSQSRGLPMPAGRGPERFPR